MDIVRCDFNVHSTCSNTHKKPETNLSEMFAVPPWLASLDSPIQTGRCGYFEPAIADLTKSILSGRSGK